ncbi:glycosyltransferase family 4 protein [Mechercharimyces sp. CAU 1602]|uniref:glycosyltransferase family 4 protein n=1 Tax=Mechercharimyces sp. CAU 1602 TaxID=2973933 RepID=UPI002161BE87|nr:glycosyltransferase family 4 protein [Mechercharimyces sp. CAU 1602]MCS1350155.1 glycosyltransferase family 4 protein [Mechercharimyces sp. CAU 1602]
MRVVIPVAALHTGGGCKVLVELANALQSKGHETIIVIPKKAPIDYPIHCELYKVPALDKEYIPFGDIVLPNFYTTFIPAYAAWPQQCVRWSLGFEPLWVSNKELARWTYQQGIPIISISHWLARKIKNISKDPVYTVNLGVDRKQFYPAHPYKKTRKIGSRTILYIARDPKAGYALKGFDDFVKALKILKKIYPHPFHVNMICTEGLLSLPKGISYQTFKPKGVAGMVRLYRNADLFVSTSWFEGFSIPPLEAMSCGTPVITTNSGGILDFCHHLKNAYVAEGKNPRAIAMGIKFMLERPALMRTFITEGLQTANTLTQPIFENNMVGMLESIYNRKDT